MKELVPERKSGETALYEEDPFELGELAGQELVLVPDFLPRPRPWCSRSRPRKRSPSRSARTLWRSFREKAQELGAPYQRMIRNLLDAYVAQHRGR